MQAALEREKRRRAESQGTRPPPLNFFRPTRQSTGTAMGQSMVDMSLNDQPEQRKEAAQQATSLIVDEDYWEVDDSSSMSSFSLIGEAEDGQHH